MNLRWWCKTGNIDRKAGAIMFSIPESWSLYINIGIIVFYLLFFLAGWKRGVLYQIVTTIGTIASLVIAFRYCTLMSSYLHLWPRSLTPFQDTLFADQIYLYMNELVCFLILFLIARLVFHLLEKLTEGLQEVPVFKQIGSLLGGLFGIVTATVWVFILCFILNTGIVKNGVKIQELTLFSTIKDGVVFAAEECGLTVDGSRILDKVYEEIRNLDDKDIHMIDSWLEEHGYEQAEGTGE